jgi:hypothetical protein
MIMILKLRYFRSVYIYFISSFLFTTARSLPWRTTFGNATKGTSKSYTTPVQRWKWAGRYRLLSYKALFNEIISSVLRRHNHGSQHAGTNSRTCIVITAFIACSGHSPRPEAPKLLHLASPLKILL